MRLRKLGRPSPATVIALIALFFSISGFAFAAKGMITGKDIKDGSVTSKDLAKGAVKAKNLAKGAVGAAGLAPGSVTASTLAPNAVTASTLAPNAVTPAAIAPGAVQFNALSQTAVTGVMSVGMICPNGIIAVVGRPCPAGPDRYATATNVATNETFSPGGDITCYIRSEVPFSTISEGPEGSGKQNPPGTQIFTPIARGVFTVTVNGTWLAGGGVKRVFGLQKVWGPGPYEGQTLTVGSVDSPPSGSGTTSQSLTTQVALEAGDYLKLLAGSCGPDAGADVDLEKVTVSLKYNIGTG